MAAFHDHTLRSRALAYRRQRVAYDRASLAYDRNEDATIESDLEIMMSMAFDALREAALNVAHIHADRHEDFLERASVLVDFALLEDRPSDELIEIIKPSGIAPQEAAFAS